MRFPESIVYAGAAVLSKHLRKRFESLMMTDDKITELGDGFDDRIFSHLQEFEALGPYDLAAETLRVLSIVTGDEIEKDSAIDFLIQAAIYATVASTSHVVAKLFDLKEQAVHERILTHWDGDPIGRGNIAKFQEEVRLMQR